MFFKEMHPSTKSFTGDPDAFKRFSGGIQNPISIGVTFKNNIFTMYQRDLNLLGL